MHEVHADEALRRWIADNGEALRLDYPLSAESVVLDIGGHVGDWAADILARYDCHLHLFEPVREACEQARRRFADNPKVHVHELALGERDGEVGIALRGTGSTLFGGGGEEVQPARMREIGTTLAELGVRYVDLCKINIEGAEFDLLEHILDTGLIVAFGDLQIQFHDVFPDAARRRRAIRDRLAESHAVTYDYAFVWENWTRRRPVVGGYEVIDRGMAAAARSNGWDFPDVAERQERAFAPLLADVRAGRPRIDFAVAAESIRAAGLARPTVLEVGCGSGYVADALDHLLDGAFTYVGVDPSAAMVGLARRTRPAREFMVSSAAPLPFDDGAVDIVLNGVSLMHTVDYARAIAEAARVAGRYCIFHTVPVLQTRPTTYLRKLAYGRGVVEVILHESELLDLLRLNGLTVERTWDSLAYDLAPVLGEPTVTRTYLCAVPSSPPEHMVNIGCGARWHPDWVNLDKVPSAPGVLRHDVAEPLPLADGSCRMVYHSHVLEHLPRHQAPTFLAECFRVLRPGGILRVAVPDLEQICRAYLDALELAVDGAPDAAARHQWMTVELIDQMTREESGGEMWRYWSQSPVPAEDFVRARVGHEAALGIARASAAARGRPPRLFQPRRRPSAAAQAAFRDSGEVHLWMYDRVSLAGLLAGAGFVDIVLRRADESYLPGFAEYHLDTLEDGRVRKPDSLIMEARRPPPAVPGERLPEAAAYDRALIVNQNLPVAELAAQCRRATGRALVVTSHELFPDERAALGGDVDVMAFNDILDDTLQAECDARATACLAPCLDQAAVRDRYPHEFMAISTRLKNEALRRALASRLAGARVCHVAGLGIHDAAWRASGSEALSVSPAPDAPSSAPTPALNLVHDETEAAVFVSPVGRLRFAAGVRVLALDWPAGLAGLAVRDPSAARRAVHDAIAPHVEGRTWRIATTVHGYAPWMRTLAPFIEIYVDGYHPPNYPRAYFDYYPPTALIRTNDPVSVRWFADNGATVAPAPLLAPVTLAPPIPPQPSGPVVFALNHAGDWSALINRADTDRLVMAAARLAEERPDIEVVVRPHPTMSMSPHEGTGALERLRRFIADAARPNLSLSLQSLETDFARAQILVSEYSQVLIDAVRRGTLGLAVNLTGRRSFLREWEALGLPATDEVPIMIAAISRMLADPGGAARAQAALAERFNRLAKDHFG